MDGFEVWNFPINWPELSLICDLLRRENVFTLGFGTNDVDAYNPLSYCRQNAYFGNEFMMIADRNIITRLVALIKGKAPTSQHRIAAAVMTFAYCADINIEPNIAIYEVAVNDGNHTANKELHLFRIADNLPPVYWKNIALGRQNKNLPRKLNDLNQEPTHSFDFEIPLRRWRRNYILALKIAELSLRGGKSETRMMELLQWMYDDFLIGGPAILLASHYLAPNNEREGLLKNLWSPVRDRAILGVQNAAWDLTILSEWLRQIQIQEQNNTFVLLCSLDKKLIKIANSLVDVLPINNLKAHFEALWGPEKGHRISNLLEECRGNANNQDRQLNREASADFIDRLINEGETFVRNWKTPSGKSTEWPASYAG